MPEKEMKHVHVITLMGCWMMLTPASGLASETPSPVLRQVRYGFTINNTSGDLLDKVSFYACAPVSATAYQRCLRLTSSHPYLLHADTHGNQVLEFVLRHVPPFSTEVITLEATLEMSDRPGNVEGPPGSAYLRPEPLMAFDQDDFLREIPPALRFTMFDSAEQIYTWVGDRVEDVGYQPRDRGATYALQSGQGDCTEFSCLFTALCRRQGLPARRLAGVVTDKNCKIGPADLHNWSEFLEDGVWYPADPQHKVFKTGGSQYVALKILEYTTKPPMPGLALYHVDHPGLEVEVNR